MKSLRIKFIDSGVFYFDTAWNCQVELIEQGMEVEKAYYSVLSLIENLADSVEFGNVKISRRS